MNLSECRYFIKMQHVKPHHPQAHSRAHTFDVGLPTYANALKAQDQTFTRLYLAVGCASVTPLIFTSLRPVKIKGVTEARACTALQHLPPPLPRQVAYVGWYTWLIRTPANLSVTLGSSNEVTVLRNLPIPCSNPRLWIPGSKFLFFAPPPPRCASRATSWHRASDSHPSPPLSRARIAQESPSFDFDLLSPEWKGPGTTLSSLGSV